MNTSRSKTAPGQTGFTLAEFMITLVIVGVLSLLAAPAFYHLLQQIRLTTATSALHNAMNLARMEAIKRNGRADLIARNGSWKNGWTIVADNQLIFQHEALHPDIQISSTFRHKTNANPYIAYNGTGRTRTEDSSNQPQSGTIRLSTENHVRLIVVNFLGRIRVCNPATAPTRTCHSASLD